MFLLRYSPEGYQLHMNARNNSGSLTIEIDKLHDRFQPSKTAVELVNFNGEWPNSQLDAPLVASLRRLVVNHSMASYAIRHDRKSVANHSWIFISCKLLPSQTGNSRRSRPGSGSVDNRSQSITSQSEVGRKCITAAGPLLWFWGLSLWRQTNEWRARVASSQWLVVRSQVTLITWPIIHFLFTRMSVAPQHRCKR